MVTKLLRCIIYIGLLIWALLCLLPFLMVVTSSLTSEDEIIREGYKLIPNHIDFTAYRVLFLDSASIFNGYKVSMIVTSAGTLLSVLLCAMLAYPISQKRVRYRKYLSVYVMITILFNGGMVPWYIVCVRYLHLKDNIAALIVPYLLNAWYVFLLRNYFRTIPDEMHESAKIDGASEFMIFFKIMLPLSTPVIATVALFVALNYWNDWWLGLMLIDRNDLKPLQILLRTIVSNVQFLQSSGNVGTMRELTSTLPAEGIKMATCVVTIGPIVFVYPYIQKYFIKGIMIGAVKG